MNDIALKIMVVEDNDALREATLAFLQKKGHVVRGVPLAGEIDDIKGGFVPDVYVIDLNLPDEDGLTLTRRLRAVQPQVGIVITTARTQIGDKVFGYESGADVYLTKPVEPNELSACIAALGKRRRANDSPQGSVTLELARMQLRGAGGTLDLTASDASILTALARAPGQTLERWQIADILGADKASDIAAATIEMRITRLRRKLQTAGAPSPQIKALHKVGYTLCCPVVLR